MTSPSPGAISSKSSFFSKCYLKKRKCVGLEFITQGQDTKLWLSKTGNVLIFPLETHFKGLGTYFKGCLPAYLSDASGLVASNNSSLAPHQPGLKNAGPKESRTKEASQTETGRIPSLFLPLLQMFQWLVIIHNYYISEFWSWYQLENATRQDKL